MLYVKASFLKPPYLSVTVCVLTRYIATSVPTNVFVPVGFNLNIDTLYRFHLESHEKLLLEVMA